MRARLTRLTQLTIDCLSLALALAIGFLVRFDGSPPADMVGRLMLVCPYVVLLEYLCLVAFRVPRRSWRYVAISDALRILAAMVVGTGVLVATRFGFEFLSHSYPYLRHGILPLGVIAVNGAVGFLGVSGARVLRRVIGEARESSGYRGDQRPPVRTILVGAGQGGVLVAKEVTARPDLGIKVVGFLDDDPAKLGVVIHGARVLGSTEQLPAVCGEYRAEQILITMASARGGVVRRIMGLAEAAGVSAKIIPGLYQIVGGRVNLSRMRPVAIEDLLRREPVQLEHAHIAHGIQDRVVVVTGAGGSIGSELCRQIAEFAPRRLVLMERSENALFEIHRELTANYPGLEVTPRIADVTDEPRVRQIFQHERPAFVLHAAAHKHVPMMEWNVGEAVKNNVFGSRTVADAAAAAGVDVFVMISTDKGSEPTSVMGATKRAAEVYLQALAQMSGTRFVTVRFGNVLGSTGSVVPIFRQQIAKGGPVTITHPDMRRYFMTIPEACQLVLQANLMGAGGEIFILDMGDPVRIVDLAKDLIRLSGLRLGEDIDIEFTGVRPGEKLFEELSTDSEQADKTRHPKIFVGRIARTPASEVESGFARMQAALAEGRDPLPALRTLVPEYSSEAPPSVGEHRREAEPSRSVGLVPRLT
ncbi:MAG: nucleoside-diphosphate sugar epimerase/dehydratase [Polyangiaceae bacterium]